MPTLLDEDFVALDQRPMDFGAMPVRPHQRQAPVIPSDRWRVIDEVLHKEYSFRRQDDRDAFVGALLAYERKVQHHARIVVEEGKVSLQLHTQDVDRVTGIDKEYARFADVVWKDLVYTSREDDVGCDDAGEG
jgi:pterin-4a-carbinolamine dehydratase